MGGSAPPRDEPLALKGSDGRRQIIVAADDLAQRYGIRVGMPVAQAKVILKELVVLDHDPHADAEGLEKLALWALRHYTPVAAADPPAGLVLDIAGAAHLKGGEDALLKDVIFQLTGMQVAACGAIADTWGAAHGLVRFGRAPTQVIPTGAVNTADALASLPVDALRLPADLLENLHLLGIDTIGELVAKPRAPLAHRFGAGLWRRVDQAYGRLAEPITPVDDPELISVQRIFFEPISAPETLAKYTGKLVDMICDRLEEAAVGARRVDLHFYRTDNRIETIFVLMAKPVREPKRMNKLLCDQLEKVDPGFGVDKMIISAPLVEALALTQVVATYSDAAVREVDDLWDVLANRYGADRLYRAEPAPSDIPERAVRRIPPTAPVQGSKRNARFRRPPRLIRPQRVEVIWATPDYPPKAFTWQGVRHRAVYADGPERIFGEWWMSEGEAGKVRDYFIVEVESGQRFWLFRTGDGLHADTGSLTWYMHGQFA